MEYLNKIIRYWYFFFVASAFTLMFQIKDWYSLLVVVTVLVGLYSMCHMKWRTIDYVMLFAMVYSLVSFLFSNYNIMLYYYGIKVQLVSMFFYFIARSRYFSDDSFIENFKWPMFIVIVAGIVLYFFPPGWYTAFRYSSLVAEEGSISFYEHTRMSSFFPHPYFLGYGSCFFIIYVVKCILVNQKVSSMHYIALCIAFFTLFFSQMRVAITYTIAFFVLAIAYQIFYGKKNTTFIKFLSVLVLTGTVSFFCVESLMSDEFLYYVTQRSTEHKGSIVDERFSMFSYFLQYISFCGQGLGRFGHAALQFNLRSCCDCEYIRILAELGYIGGLLILSPIIYAIIQGFRHLHLTFFETFVLLFFPFAMIGAAPLEEKSQHCYLLWFCVGHIITKINNEYGINNPKLQQLRRYIKLLRQYR